MKINYLKCNIVGCENKCLSGRVFCPAHQRPKTEKVKKEKNEKKNYQENDAGSSRDC